LPGELIRPARSPRDIAHARALFEAYAAQLGVSLCFQGFDAELAGLPGDYAPPRGTLLLARVDGEIAGCVALRPADDVYWLEHFLLVPELQGKGIGSAVLSSLLERPDREGALTRLNVLQGSAARRLYERHGFVLESEDEVDVYMVRTPANRTL